MPAARHAVFRARHARRRAPELRPQQLPLLAAARNPQALRAPGVAPWRSVAAALVLHLVLMTLLGLSPPRQQAPPASRRIEALLIAPLREAPTAPAVAPPLPPAPTRPPPPPPKPAAAVRKAPQPAAAAAPPKAPAAAASSSPVAQQRPGVDSEQESDSLLQRLRANWLAPPQSAAVFRCRVHIDYRAGGVITRVQLHDGCGDPSLGDSIERAVWKTQPLPGVDRGQAGSVEVDFSP